MSAPRRGARVRVKTGRFEGTTGEIVTDWPTPWPARPMVVVRSESLVQNAIVTVDQIEVTS